MPDGIVVDYATIHAAADDCQKTGGELQAQFDQLKQDLAPLINSWEGAAREAYGAAQKAWDDSFEDLKQVLAQIAAVLPQLADGYQGTESGVEQLF
ncbi:WXG100 family type VII secretion target [Amycolatopsis xylanica]|uniref:ESAT-6-like protein n=1 Tax=Amycolatopsis xylanica TaxID=589385 RepID=A0A1H3LL42_9PSEU|nr:WXG100 family type VII secretion target [Amycolatopsis xylanica]SDY64859.1 WXG100 family type VII secretion target [Amycolatopsis xylanica]